MAFLADELICWGEYVLVSGTVEDGRAAGCRGAATADRTQPASCGVHESRETNEGTRFTSRNRTGVQRSFVMKTKEGSLGRRSNGMVLRLEQELGTGRTQVGGIGPPSVRVQKNPVRRGFVVLVCGRYRTRTDDLFRVKEARYQLRQSPAANEFSSTATLDTSPDRAPVVHRRATPPVSSARFVYPENYRYSLQSTQKCAQLRMWRSGSASPCQGEGREFESRHPLEVGRPKGRFSLV